MIQDIQACKFLEKRDGLVSASTLIRHLKITRDKAIEILERWKKVRK